MTLRAATPSGVSGVFEVDTLCKWVLILGVYGRSGHLSSVWV